MAEQKTIVGQTVAEVADVVDAKVVKAIEGTEDKLDTLISKAAEVLQQYGPDVADATLSILRIDAVVHAIGPIIAAIVVVAFIPILLRFQRWLHRGARIHQEAEAGHEHLERMFGKDWRKDRIRDTSGGYALLIICSVIILLILSFAAVNGVAPLAGIFVPEYWALVKAGVL